MDTDYLFENDCNHEIYEILLKRTKPTKTDGIKFLRKEFDFKSGNFKFYIEGSRNKNFEIPFYNKTYSLNNLWKFLEAVILSAKPLIFTIFHAGVDTILYTAPMPKDCIRFVVFDTNKLNENLKSGKFFHYSLIEAETDTDIEIKKKVFIKAFYDELRAIFEEIHTVSFFEYGKLNMQEWIEDSEIIKDYLTRKKR